MQLTLQHNDGRLKKIEDTLWPPQRPGTHGNPNAPPYDPAGLQAALEGIHRNVLELKAKEATHERRLEEVIRALIEWSRNVRAHQRTLEQLQKMLPIPAAG